MSSRDVATATRCPKCEAEIRDGSLFCYNCGDRVAESNGSEPPAAPASAAEERSTKPAPGLRTARDIRRRERPSGRTPRVVVWESTDTGPELQLIIVTAGVIVFTIIVVLLILYIK